MKKIYNYFENYIYQFSIVGLFLYIFSYYSSSLNIPSVYRTFCCIDDRRLNFFLIFIPVFLLLLIFRKFKNNKYIIYKNITLVYLFLYIIIYFSVSTHGDGYMWFQRETVSFYGAIVYALFSIIFLLF